jgi:hypothetical protein
MKSGGTKSGGGFRALLGLGAVVTLLLGAAGLLSVRTLASVLGLEMTARAARGGAGGLARLFGAAMVAVGVTYILAAAQPQRSRSLLVPLFVAPAVLAVAAIASTAKGEMKGAQGAIFAVYNAAYCLLYFRMDPRVAEPAKKAPENPPENPPATPARPPPSG